MWASCSTRIGIDWALTLSRFREERPSSINPTPNKSQNQNGFYKLESGTNEVGIWSGGSFHSPTFIGSEEGRKFVVAGLEYARVLAASERMSYEYVADVIPLAYVFQPRQTSRSPGSVYGAGISPIGLRINFGQEASIKPFASASVGFLYFANQVPLDGATQFNFTVEFGGGVRIFTSSKRAIMVGYKLHHLSNGGLSRVNPGLDANIFYAGFSIFK